MATKLVQDSMVEQYRDLIFALQDCWGVVHAQADESTKSKCRQLLRENTDFAHRAPDLSTEMNARLYHALELAKPSVDRLFVSDSLRSTLKSVLGKHQQLARSWFDKEIALGQESDDGPSP